MHKYFLFALLACMSFLKTSAQQSISVETVREHIGDSVIVCGKIFGGKFLDAAHNQPTFLNMGAAYPNQLLTVVIWGAERKLFGYKPEEYLKGKMVCITGRIEFFKEKPQIVIQKITQLQPQ